MNEINLLDSADDLIDYLKNHELDIYHSINDFGYLADVFLDTFGHPAGTAVSDETKNRHMVVSNVDVFVIQGRHHDVEEFGGLIADEEGRQAHWDRGLLLEVLKEETENAVNMVRDIDDYKLMLEEKDETMREQGMALATMSLSTRKEDGLTAKIAGIQTWLDTEEFGGWLVNEYPEAFNSLVDAVQGKSNG